jgi:hypothetical protein
MGELIYILEQLLKHRRANTQDILESVQQLRASLHGRVFKPIDSFEHKQAGMP